MELNVRVDPLTAGEQEGHAKGGMVGDAVALVLPVLGIQAQGGGNFAVVFPLPPALFAGGALRVGGGGLPCDPSALLVPQVRLLVRAEAFAPGARARGGRGKRVSW